MIIEQTFDVSDTEAGERLDCLVCRRYDTTSRAFCRQAIQARHVLVNDRPRDKGFKVRTRDRITILKLKEHADQRVLPNAAIPLDVVFEDASLIAVNKPAGIAVHPLVSEERGTLMNGLVARYPELTELGDQPLMAGALHRIDTNTSGLVVAARSQMVFNALREQFTRQRVEKIYWALVEGHVALAGRLVHALAHHPHLPFCKMVDATRLKGKVRQLHAETVYRPLELIGRNTLLEVTIRTGVTHQIRCQLSLAGMPVVNDTRYDACPIAGCMRHFLHAREMRFRHPVSDQRCCIQAPLTSDFQHFNRLLSTP